MKNEPKDFRDNVVTAARINGVRFREGRIDIGNLSAREYAIYNVGVHDGIALYFDAKNAALDQVGALEGSPDEN